MKVCGIFVSLIDNSSAQKIRYDVDYDDDFELIINSLQ